MHMHVTGFSAATIPFPVPSGRSGAASASLPSLRRLSESCPPDRRS